MELEIEEVRKPTEAYLSFCKANGFEPEKAFPVIIQPMWAESYGIATSHPNQDLLMIDYFEGDDSSDRFGRRMTSSLSIFRDIKKAVEAAKTDRRWSDYRMSGADKCWARYGSAGLIKSEMDTPRARHFIEAAETLFRVLQLPEFQIFSDGYEMQAEFGPDTTTNGPILYQWKPFMKRKRTDRMVDRYNSDIVFGVCDGLELPVVKIKSGTNLTDDDFETSDSGGPRMLWQMAVNGNNKMDMAKMANYYHERELEKAAEMYPNGFCLAMSGYKEFDNIDFNRFKPKAVVIGRDFRSGMLHNRANLVQMNPVVIFSSGLYLEEADRVRISSDGVGALVEKL
jgi:hypothetical protein